MGATRYFAADLPIRRVQLLALLVVAALLPALSASPAAADPKPGDSWVTDGDVDAMTIANGKVYIGGRFTQVGPNTGGGAEVESVTGVYDPSFDRVDGEVYAVVSDGAGGWYIGGEFSFVDGLSRPRVAHIGSNGAVTGWRPNVPSGAVYALHRIGDALYIGGEFTQVGASTRNNLAAVDITSESAVLLAWNPDANGAVRAIVGDGGTGVLVGGDFTLVGGLPRSRLAQVDMTTAAVGAWDPDANGTVHTIADGGSVAFVGGDFTTIGAASRPSVAAVAASGSATSWNPGTDGSVRAIAVDGSTVYVAGAFATVGGAARANLAAIDATTGTPAPWNPAPDGPVYAAAIDASDLVVGGDFLTIGATGRERVARITAAGAVTGFDPDANGSVLALAVDGGDTYIGGAFNSVNGVDRARLAAVDATTGVLDMNWAPAANDDVIALEVSSDGSVIFIGGAFTTINGADHRRIAAVSASDGSIDGSFFAQANNRVHALHAADGSLYVGGDFGTISSNARKRIAKLDEVTGAVAAGWDPQVDDSVRAIATSPDGTLVYLGGLFDDIDGSARNEIAALDAATGALDPTWNPNTNRRVYEFEVTSEEVLVAMGGGGGRAYSFDPISGATNWFIHVDGDVQTLATRGDHVYVGGHFLNVGTESRPYFLAAELATGGLSDEWAPSGNGGLGPFTMVEHNGRIWTGGEFTEIEGRSAGRLAPLDAIVFAPPGSYRDRVLADGADVYYRFGESAGSVAVDEAGSLDGTYLGNVSLGQPPLVAGSDTAVALDGAGDSVAVPDSDLVNTGGPFEERTIELWFQADNMTTRQILFEEGGATRGVNLYIEAGLLHFGGWNTSDNGDGTTPWPAPLFLTTPVAAGQPHHAVLVFDHDDSLRAYLDGRLVAESAAVGRLFGHGNDVAFGAVAGTTRVVGGSTSNAAVFSGILDDAAIYNTALSDVAVAGHYLLGSLSGSTPQALIVRPAAGSVVSGGTTISVAAEDAEDDLGTLEVEVSIDGGATWAAATYQAGTGAYEYAWDTTVSADGDTTLLARATDSNANTGTSPGLVVTVDNLNDPPSVAVVEPADGATVTGTVAVEIDAADAEDPAGSLAVEVRFDAGPWLPAAWQPGSGRYTHLWDTSGAAPGDVDIEARATDSGAAETLSTVVNVTVAPAAPYPERVAADGAQVHWRLGEGSGITAVDSIGDVDGTYAGGVALGRTGLITGDPDTAAGFDGGNDVVEVPDSPLLNLGGPFEAKTIELWFNADDVVTRGVLYEQGGVTRGLVLYVEGGRLHGGVWNTSTNGDGTTPWAAPVFVSAPIAAGQDHHAVLSYSMSADEVALYVDGLRRDAAGGVGRLFAHSANVGIGGMRNGSRFVTGGVGGAGFHFDGAIDEVASYDDALDGTAVAAHFQLGAGVGTAPVVEMASPGSGDTVSGLETIGVVAADGQDATGSLDVDVRVDGGPWNQAAFDEATGRYEWEWDTSSSSNGTVTLEARATDSEPATTIAAAVAVEVANASGYSSTVLADTPDVYWRLDETSEAVAADIVNGVDGAYTNGVSLGQPGLVGDGAAPGFDGIDDYVAVPDSSLINLGGPRETRTIELWFEADEVSSRQVVYEEGGNSRGINIYIEDGSLVFGAWNRTAHGDGTTPWPGGEVFLPTPVAAGTAYHVVLTLDQPADELRGYLNGTPVVSATGIGRLYAHSADIGIGAMNNQARFAAGGQTGSGYHFGGRIDEVAVYNSVLSGARIAVHYTAGI